MEQLRQINFLSRETEIFTKSVEYFSLTYACYEFTEFELFFFNGKFFNSLEEIEAEQIQEFVQSFLYNHAATEMSFSFDYGILKKEPLQQARIPKVVEGMTDRFLKKYGHVGDEKLLVKVAALKEFVENT